MAGWVPGEPHGLADLRGPAGHRAHVRALRGRARGACTPTSPSDDAPWRAGVRALCAASMRACVVVRARTHMCLCLCVAHRYQYVLMVINIIVGIVTGLIVRCGRGAASKCRVCMCDGSAAGGRFLVR
jgi:hypothetical protein